jgi:ubiquinone/menaquinone biosynthesis C-methylase UbiE
MTHKFDVNNRHKLDNEKRRAALPPHETLIRLGYKEGADLADIGCGIGYFTIPAAKIGGNSAKIFAVDVSQIMLQEVENRANEASINNIITIKSDECKFNLKSDSVSFVLISLVLHEIDEKEMFIKEATEALKSAGTIALIEWQMVENGNGPPLVERISFESMTELLTKVCYQNIAKIDIGEDYYGITATKP